MPKADIAVIGLGVMGRNLALNINDHGFKVAVYNRTTARVDEFLLGQAAGTNIEGTWTLEELVDALQRPRRLMLMISAGTAVDTVIQQLLPLLDSGDIVIDGGNSQFTETIRRAQELERRSLSFIGTGISGGEEGARVGPSIMPGGTVDAWKHVQQIFQSIAAKADDGSPCCEWLGPDGAGHYVKMVHNGIEYADMQMIAEAYDLLRRGGHMTTEELQPIFTSWNNSKLGSFLLEITADIMGFLEDGRPLVENILGVAEQKGTGKWTVVSSMHTAIPASTIAEAVYARILSAFANQREQAAEAYGPPASSRDVPRDQLIADLHDALYASKIVAYAQGFHLMHETSAEHGWQLDPQSIARIWRAGCIIRSRILGDIIDAFAGSPELPHLMLAPAFVNAIRTAEPGWRRTLLHAIEAGIPVPALSSALSFYDGYRSNLLPANLIQAQRDYFGSHTYERLDRPRGEYFHTDWTGSGENR